jgi:hypothetical protein
VGNSSLYVVRAASQQTTGELRVNVASFLRDKEAGTKAFHHKWRRVGWQESSAQNNFRRIIASLIPKGEFCNHKVNYLPEPASKLPLEFVLGLLNSRLADWYFRLGSSNAAVSHYQIGNLPVPLFAPGENDESRAIATKVRNALRLEQPDEALKVLRRVLDTPPFSLAVREAVIEAVKRIIAIEQERGEISRTDRAALDTTAQPYQDFIDQLMYGMAGLTDDEIRTLESSHEQML